MPKWDINFDYRVDMDEEILEYLVKIEAHRQITARIPVPPRVAREIDGINIVRQIKGTTGIEGNTLTEPEIKQIIEAVDNVAPRPAAGSPPNNADLEVTNAYEVQKFIRSAVHARGSDVMVTEDLIRKLHYLNTKGIASDISEPGVYRKGPVYAGDYVPPEPEAIPGLMKEFLRVVNDRRLVQGLSPMIRAVIAHFYLVSVHPFGDGNGRTSRALEAYLLYQSRFNARGFYSLANFFYRNRERYIAELQDARFKYDGNLTSFVRFALSGFVEEIETIQGMLLKFVRETMFLRYVDELYQKDAINSRCVTILDFLVKYEELLTVQQLKDRRTPLARTLYQGVKTDRTILRDLGLMKKYDLVSEEKGLLRAKTSIMEQFVG